MQPEKNSLSPASSSPESVAATRQELIFALAKVCDVAIWMSGSPSFGPEGEAHEGWVTTMRPKLYEALDVLERTEADVPA